MSRFAHAATRLGLAGVTAAIAFLAFSMLWFGFGGQGAWRPLNLIAHSFWRQAPTGSQFHAGATALAAFAVLVVGVGAMAPFGALALGAGLRPLGLVAGAVIYANVLWVPGHYLIWESLDPLAARGFSPGVAWLGHMVAGLAGGVALVWQPLRRRAPALRRRHAH